MPYYATMVCFIYTRFPENDNLIGNIRFTGKARYCSCRMFLLLGHHEKREGTFPVDIKNAIAGCNWAGLQKG